MFDHDIGLDWAQKVMAIARITKKGRRLHEVEGRSDIADLKAYLENLKGSKRLVFEESTSSQWLYTELRSSVDEVIVCDPRRNRLLSEGPKTDKIDARKLVELLRADMVKPVFHSGDSFIEIRKLVSGYIDLVQSGVRLQNQRAALLRAQGRDRKETSVEGDASSFVLSIQDAAITSYEENKKLYIKEFNRLTKKHRVIRLLKSVPGLNTINAVKVAAIVVDPRRFPSKSHFLAYCGMIKYEMMSGDRNYGWKRPNYNRIMKNVFDTAAIACIQAGDNNFLKKEYLYLKNEKKLPEHNARHAIARKSAILTWGVMKSDRKFDPNKRRKDKARKDMK